MRARASLGTIPEYGAGIVGVLLGGVRPGSPAEKAGLQAGDILIGFAGRSIRNVEEYTFALSEHGPGETVEIRVKRGDREIVVKATLAESRR
jgi:S1-C subfamily serine protease